MNFVRRHLTTIWCVVREWIRCDVCVFLCVFARCATKAFSLFYLCQYWMSLNFCRTFIYFLAFSGPTSSVYIFFIYLCFFLARGEHSKTFGNGLYCCGSLHIACYLQTIHSIRNYVTASDCVLKFLSSKLWVCFFFGRSSFSSHWNFSNFIIKFHDIYRPIFFSSTSAQCHFECGYLII